MTEHEEQVELMQMAEKYHARYPEVGLLFAIPNGGKRNIVVAKKLKAEGVKAGVPDLCLPIARGGFHGLYIELKRKKGGRVSDDQSAWLRTLAKQGYMAVLAKGADEAWDAIRTYISLPNHEAHNAR